MDIDGCISVEACSDRNTGTLNVCNITAVDAFLTFSDRLRCGRLPSGLW